MPHPKLARLSADDLRRLQEDLHIRLTAAMAEVAYMNIPDLRRLAVLGSRIEHSAQDLSAIDHEVVERDLLESLPDATGPEELAQIMQFIQ
jgi:hypothetical protein